MKYSKIAYIKIYPNKEKLPSVNRTLSKQSLPSTERKNKIEYNFPNSDITLDITTTSNKKNNCVKYVLEIKNLHDEDNYQFFEEHLTSKIRDEVKNLALKKLIDER